MLSNFDDYTTLQRKLEIGLSLCFDTAWRIGSGREGETLSDLGVLLDPTGQPLLPGSSLKGRLRSTCETLAHALGLSACMLDRSVSGIECTSDVKYYRQVREDFRKASRNSPSERLKWIDEHTCDVCKLFGSPVMSGRLRVSEGTLQEWAGVVQVRDGVVIDRDSQTTVDGLKYDYEVVPAGARFKVTVSVENHTDSDLALLGAAVFEWSSGSTIGGSTSRGLGQFHLEDIHVRGVDLSSPEQRVRFLTRSTPEDRLMDMGDWKDFFAKRIDDLISGQTS